MRVPTLILLTGAVLATGWALTAWPHLTEVETGRTPEYPDFQPRQYRAAPAAVAQALAACFAAPRWKLIGSGSGPGGGELHALYRTPLVGLEHDVIVRLTAEGGGTRVRVRSRSRTGPLDFGQNARNIRALLVALDARLR